MGPKKPLRRSGKGIEAERNKEKVFEAAELALSAKQHVFLSRLCVHFTVYHLGSHSKQLEVTQLEVLSTVE